MWRGGAGSPPGTPPFDLSTIELDALPRILRAAREAVDGPEPSSLPLARADDGEVVWHVALWTNEGSRQVQVALDGTVRSDTGVHAPVEVHPEDL